MEETEKDDPVPAGGTKRLEKMEAIYARREVVASLIKKMDETAIWDTIQSRDVPAELIDYVCDQLKKGKNFGQIRKKMGILRSNDKSWQKIMAALKRGTRIDGTAFLVQKSYELQAMSDKLKDQIMEAFDKGTPVVTKNSDGSSQIEYVHGPSKELSATIDAYNRLQQGYVKLGRDLGAFVDETGGKGGGGVTIVVQNQIPMPDQKVIDARHEDQRKKNEALVEQSKAVVLTTGVPVPDGNG